MEQCVHKGESAVLFSVFHAFRINRSADVYLKRIGLIVRPDEFDVFPYPFKIQFLSLDLFGKLFADFIL